MLEVMDDLDKSKSAIWVIYVPNFKYSINITKSRKELIVLSQKLKF